MTNYDVFNLIKSKVRPQVRYEIGEIIATKKDIDLRNLQWKDINDLISDARGTASRRKISYYDHTIQASDTDQPAKPAALASRDIVPPTAHPSLTVK